MKVAFLSFDFGEYSIRLASALAEYAPVLLLLPEGLADPYLANLNERVMLRTFPRVRLRQPWEQLRRNQWLFQQIRSFGAEVLHLQQGAMWFNISLQFEHRFPVVLTVHDPEPHPGDRLSRKTPYWFWKLGFRRADRIIVHNRHVQQTLQRRLGRSKLLHVIPHVQIGQGCAATVDKDDGMTVLFFGRIWPYKGVEYLIRAEPLITKKIPGVKIVIAGIGEDFEPYRKMMAHPDRFVVVNRYIPEKEAEGLFQSASLVVIPYIESSQSGVVPVAYSYSKPVVATRVGGLPEAVVDGITGTLVPPRDERKLADAIIHLLGNSELRRRMGKAGKEYVEHECSPMVVARDTIEVYRIACSNGQQLRA